MPVNVLYCEGIPKGPDTRVLSNVLSDIRTNIKPVGVKYCLERRISGARDTESGIQVAGIRDRDFDNDNSSPAGKPRAWEFESKRIGWTWERKEIENYMIDPEVVKRTLKFEDSQAGDYQKALNESAKRIADYTAARTTLSLSEIRSPSIINCWGEKREDNYHFPKDKGLKLEDCRSKLGSIISRYQKIPGPEETDKMWECFDRLRKECNPGGCRFKYFMTFFAGKDLLYGMRDKLKKFGFDTPRKFCEKILRGMENSSEDVWKWLPEWSELHEIVSK